MRLHALVEASSAVSATRSRLEKISRLAEILGQLTADEIAIAVAYLSGAFPQGRIGLGWAAVAEARSAGAAELPALELRDVDAAFAQIGRVSGPGAARTRSHLLGELFARATRDEQDFLMRLVGGELRQGALEGILTEAVARAAHAPTET